MDCITNEAIFYGGIIIAACSLLAALIYFFISKIRKMNLDARLDAEYGKKVKVKSK